MSRKKKEIQWHQAFRTIEPYVVKIITPQGSGTGFHIASTARTHLQGIATAAHVVDFAHYWEQPIRIQHASSNTIIYVKHEQRTIDVESKQDAATIVTKDALPFPKESLPMIAEGKCLKVGVEIAWVGYPAIAPGNLCLFSGRISSWVEDESLYFVDGVAINGVSGGPAFYIDKTEVKLIGLVSAYVPNRVTGIVLPGLCVVRDVMSLYKTIKTLKNFEEAKSKEKTPDIPPPLPVGPASSEPTKL